MLQESTYRAVFNVPCRKNLGIICKNESNSNSGNGNFNKFVLGKKSNNIKNVENLSVQKPLTEDNNININSNNIYLMLERPLF